MVGINMLKRYFKKYIVPMMISALIGSSAGYLATKILKNDNSKKVNIEILVSGTGESAISKNIINKIVEPCPNLDLSELYMAPIEENKVNVLLGLYCGTNSNLGVPHGTMSFDCTLIDEGYECDLVEKDFDSIWINVVLDYMQKKCKKEVLDTEECKEAQRFVYQKTIVDPVCKSNNQVCLETKAIVDYYIDECQTSENLYSQKCDEIYTLIQAKELDYIEKEHEKVFGENK